MTLTEHARDTLRRATIRLDEQINLTLQDPSEDPVHDLRVAIRRLSQALRTFAGLMAGKEARKMRQTLKPVLDAAAAARDLDVGSDLLIKDGLAESHVLLAKMHSERELASMALLGQLYLLRAQEVPSCWQARLAALIEMPEDAAVVAREWLPPMAEEFFRNGRKTALKGDSAPRLHAFRLSAKRLRYTLELFRPFYGPVYEKRLEQVREIQNLLGKHQDCVVGAERLRPLTALDDVIGQVTVAVEARALRLESDFRSYWHHVFDAAGEELRWMRYLGRRVPVSRPRSGPRVTGGAR